MTATMSRKIVLGSRVMLADRECISKDVRGVVVSFGTINGKKCVNVKWTYSNGSENVLPMARKSLLNVEG